MADNTAKASRSGSTWETFTLPSGGATSDIRKSVAAIKSKVTEENKIFIDASVVNGGVRIKIVNQKQ